jgi:hypothetical protein
MLPGAFHLAVLKVQSVKVAGLRSDSSQPDEGTDASPTDTCDQLTAI